MKFALVSSLPPPSPAPIIYVRSCPRSCSISRFSLLLSRFIAFCASQVSLELCDKFFFGGLLHLQYVAKSFIISRATLQICCARINVVHCVTARAHFTHTQHPRHHHHHHRRRRRHHDMTSNSNSTVYAVAVLYYWLCTIANETFGIKWQRQQLLADKWKEQKNKWQKHLEYTAIWLNEWMNKCLSLSVCVCVCFGFKEIEWH